LSADRGAELQGPDVDGRGRRLLAVAAAAAVLVLVLVLVVVGGGDDGSPAGADRTAASSTSSAPTSADTATTPTAESAAPSPAPAGGAGELPAALPAVGLEEEVVVEGLTASLSSVEAINGSANGPGNVAGPAVRVTVRLANRSTAEVSLETVAVNLFHGAGTEPASPLEDPSQRPFTGSVQPGEAAEGIYVFSVPAGDRDPVSVEVGYRAGAPRAVFTGRVA
jgi:hypothetical protein